MNPYILYLLEANIALLFFLLLYRVLLASETNFNFKRGYILTALLVSIGFPLVAFPVPGLELPTFTHTLPEVWVVGLSTSSGRKLTKAMDAISWLYWSGVAVLTVRLLFQLVGLTRLLRRASTTSSDQYGKILETNQSAPVFSFLNMIHLGNADQLNAEEKDKIIRHEMVHVKQFHSVDLLLLELLGILFWFNPAIGAYRKILRSVHEFQADKKMVGHQDPDEYIGLLTKVALLSADYPLVSQFNSVLTFKRIMMMKTLKQKMRTWKLAVLVTAFLGFAIMACQEQTNLIPGVKGKVYKEAEELPEFEGGMPALMSYIQHKLRYPKVAREMGLEGKVYVAFVVTREGNVVNPSIRKSIKSLSWSYEQGKAGDELDKAALEVVSDFPKWNPGRDKGQPVNVEFVLPINFQLSN